MARLALLCSTAGSVAKYTYLQDETATVDLVITDRDCGAKQLAEQLNVPLVQLAYHERSCFSADVLQTLRDHNIDYLISFYTRLLAEPLISAYRGALLNFHPSLLPACAGQHGFEDTMQSGALFFGSTVHLIDAGMDTGKPVIQCAAIRQPHHSLAQNRHLVFAQQCASYSQLLRWLRLGALQVSAEGACIKHGNYNLAASDISLSTPLLAAPALDAQAMAVYQAILNTGSC